MFNGLCNLTRILDGLGSSFWLSIAVFVPQLAGLRRTRHGVKVPSIVADQVELHLGPDSSQSVKSAVST